MVIFYENFQNTADYLYYDGMNRHKIRENTFVSFKQEKENKIKWEYLLEKVSSLSQFAFELSGNR